MLPLSVSVPLPLVLMAVIVSAPLRVIGLAMVAAVLLLLPIVTAPLVTIGRATLPVLAKNWPVVPLLKAMLVPSLLFGTLVALSNAKAPWLTTMLPAPTSVLTMLKELAPILVRVNPPRFSTPVLTPP